MSLFIYLFIISNFLLPIHCRERIDFVLHFRSGEFDLFTHFEYAMLYFPERVLYAK